MRAPLLPDAIPAEAPTAPTEEAWARMSPEQREQAVEALLASESLEEIEEREAMAEGDPHLDAKMGIRNTLRGHFGRLGRRIYVGADIKVYYPGRKGFTPDVIAVTDVDGGQRDCWMVSQEGRGIDLAFDVHYKRDRCKELDTNLVRYAALGIQEYWVYDLRREILKGCSLLQRGADYAPIPLRARRLHSRVLDLDVVLEAGQVRFCLGDEQAARADQMVLLLASAVVTILTVRGIEVKPDARDRILACADLPTLERWVTLAATATTSEALFDAG